MILTLVYHHVHDPKNGLHVATFAKHLDHLIARYPIVIPGDPCQKTKLNLCLSFDDAFFDFYYFVFPLLKKHNIKAVLAVPTAFIEEDTTLNPEERLNVSGYDGLHQGKSFSHNPFCTWREIKEMVSSGHVVVATHSHNHKDCTKPDLDLDNEIAWSKHLIQQNIGTLPETFVYPYGHINRNVNVLLKKHFRYVMRVGHAINLNWDGTLYRVDAQKYWSLEKGIPWRRIPSWCIKMVLNRLRGV